MKEYEINAINKPHRENRHEHITHIGNNDGQGWRMTREEVIRRIDSDLERFYTIDKTTGKKIYIYVVRGDGDKAPYLRTHADGKWQDNLLALPECKADAKLVA